MSSLRTNSRRASAEQHDPYEDDEGVRSLLSRTRSQEVNVAESIAVQDLVAVESHLTLHDEEPDSTNKWPKGIKYLILLCAFLTSLSFGTTQVPLLYAFRLMTCDAYYDSHPEETTSATQQISSANVSTSLLSYALAAGEHIVTAKVEGGPDRCSIHAIESSTALSVSLLGASTTVFGLANLFLTGGLIKRIGIKPTLLINVFFPAVRLLIQNVGVEVWGTTGIIIVQSSQIITILGGPSGYILTLNTFITEVTEYEGRTAWLGRLMGSMMVGGALGFLVGGVVAEAFDIKAPFRLALALFIIASIYAAIFLPRVAAAEAKTKDLNSTTGKKNKQGALAQFFGPLFVFAPRKYVRRDGIIQTEYGAFLLAWGVFLGILATGYLQTLLQLFATDVFEFGTKDNGWLIFMYSTLRGLFLTFVFPRLITIGRKYTAKQEQSSDNGEARSSESSERQPLLTSETSSTAATKPDAPNRKIEKVQQQFTFDLTYARFSLIADGLLTLLCTFVRSGWQMYVVAAILPFAAGTGSAAKGSILQMAGRSASSSKRTDALAGVSLVENIARLSTTFVFGVIFAAFASIGRTELTFTCNAAIALVGFAILLLARFPPEDSRPLDREETPASVD